MYCVSRAQQIFVKQSPRDRSEVCHETISFSAEEENNDA